MSTLSYNKEKLLGQLKNKRAEALKKIEESREYNKKAKLTAIQKEIDERKEDLDRVLAGQETRLYYSYNGKSDPDTRAFDLAIARLETCEDTIIKLSDKSDDNILRLIA